MNRRELLRTMPALALAQQPARGQSAHRQVAKKARLKPALCAYTFREALQNGSMTYEDLVHFAAEHGMDGIDATAYWFPDPPGDGFLLPLKRLAYRSAVHIYSLGINTVLTKASADERKGQVELIRKWVGIAERMGAAHLRVFAGKAPAGATDDQAAAWTTEALKRAVEYAGARGIILGVENHSGITVKAEVLLGIIKDVDSPWLGINLDTGNFLENQYSQMEMCAPNAVSSHLKTRFTDAAKRHQPADLDRVFRIFAESGYHGYLALEDSVGADPKTAVPPVLQQMRLLAAKYSTELS
jgi:sugar phosphate isomerase/epimerase